jgi:succinyl-CoA synthetase beta subunit
MVRFADAMALLAGAGIPVAPWAVVEGDEADASKVASLLGDLATAPSQLVVKLADVPHRTELDAVRVGVSLEELPKAVADLRAIAAAHGLPDAVAVQTMVSGHAEAFGGLHCTTSLGPVVLLGLGGVLVELANRVGGRFLPLDEITAASLAREVAGPAAIGHLRGQRPWPIDGVTQVVEGLDRLWRQHGAWLESADINPLIVADDGLVAVDALMVARRQ